jgi:hypothetical protein
MAHTLQKESRSAASIDNRLSHAPSPTRTLDLDQTEGIACLLGARAISTALRDHLNDALRARAPNQTAEMSGRFHPQISEASERTGAKFSAV